MIGTPCTADGPECPVEGDVCYGATITGTDTSHPQYIEGADAVIKEAANIRYCMNEQLCISAQQAAENTAVDTGPYSFDIVCGASKIIASLSALLIAVNVM